MQSFYVVVILYLLTLHSSSVTHGEEDASDNKVEFTDPYYYLLEYGTENYDKSLTCKATNFNLIKWYKELKLLDLQDGKYSTLEDGQILIIKKMQPQDEGNYTCIVSNDENSINRTIELIYADENFSDPPVLSSGHSCEEVKYAEKGENVKFICRYYVGLGYGITQMWAKLNTSVCNDTKNCSTEEFGDSAIILDEVNSTSGSYFYDRQCLPEHVPEDEKGYLYSCLDIYNVTEFAFGVYVNSIHNGQATIIIREVQATSPVPETVFSNPDASSYVIPAATLMLVSLIALLVWLAVGLDMRLYWKNNISSGHKAQEYKRYHSYICCSWSNMDGSFALKLKEKLEKENYKIWLPEVDSIPGNNTMEEMCDVLEQSQTFILILSSDCFGSRYQTFEVNVYMEKISAYRKNIICVMLGDISSEYMNPILKHIIKTCYIIKIKGRETRNQNISPSIISDPQSEPETLIKYEIPSRTMKTLLLAMPAKPKSSSISNSESRRDFANEMENGNCDQEKNLKITK